MTTNIDATLAGNVMASVMSLTDEDGKSIADRMSVSDLWIVIQHTVAVVRMHDVATGGIKAPRTLTTSEELIWHSPKVREELKAGRKIQAIKEARFLTNKSLKESKDFVEMMEDQGLGSRP